MLDAVMAAALQHVEEARDIGVDISVGVAERVADARLRREMDHAGHALFGESGLDRRPVAQIGADEAKSLVLLEAGEPGLLEGDVVIGAEIVEADDLVAAVEQPRRGVIADEACGPGDENAHGGRLLLLAFVNERATEAIRGPTVNCGALRAGTDTSG